VYLSEYEDSMLHRLKSSLNSIVVEDL
jgi:hypothetical protein